MARSARLILKLSNHEPLNIYSVQSKIKRRCKKLAFSDIREMYGTFLTKYEGT
jgi:hypothetical protein